MLLRYVFRGLPPLPRLRSFPCASRRSLPGLGLLPLAARKNLIGEVVDDQQQQTQGDLPDAEKSAKFHAS
ncbi:unnamed protein product [Spirodela intermedia]|uniref:Uncharacterized protein n=1 Tax=Spirodela intermedia TaxID=51605 RepID=A0A7I8K3H1_SPIIN|nr:unnamed protein product [Spirodela intermedia]